MTAGLIGALAWNGHPAMLALSFVFLLLVLVQANRRATYIVALAYYAAASWPLLPGAKVFFGMNSSLFVALTLWLVASAVLAAPWGIFHFRSWPGRICSIPLALAATTLPPVGLIGWASPLTSAGLLFPGTAWLGIVMVLFLPAVVIFRPVPGLILAGSLIAFANVTHAVDPPPPVGWVAIDTAFGRSELERPDPIAEFQHAEWIQKRALGANAPVILFPETVVPRWNTATEAFWEPTLARLAEDRKTILLGTTLSVAASPLRVNAVIVRGATRPASFYQRIPPPISMWRPFTQTGFPLRLTGPGSLRVGEQHVAFLICYELLLTWPVLSASVDHPTILIGFANDYWATGTRIPAVQRAALAAWARLFSVPSLMAANT